MVKYTVEHGGGEDRVPHHLSPVDDLLVGGKDDGAVLIGIADKGKEPVCLCSGYRGIADLIDDDELSLAYVLQHEAGRPLDLSGIEDLDEISHLTAHNLSSLSPP